MSTHTPNPYSNPFPPTPGVEMTKLLFEYGADLDAASPKDWTPLSYSKAKGKYGATEEKGVYPEVRGGWRVMDYVLEVSQSPWRWLMRYTSA